MAKIPHELWALSPSNALRVDEAFDLSIFDRASTPGWLGSKKQAKKALKAYGSELSDMQERLYANGRSGMKKALLLVLQGLDTAGKGGILRHTVGMVDPQGVQIRNFGVPSKVEAAHHHLWRIEKEAPSWGMIGVFDRSHYEQVLVVKVDSLEPAECNETRYGELLDFDRRQAAAGIDMLKVSLMVSREQQAHRLHRRLERGDKHWKFNPGDITVHQNWHAYQDAYAEMFTRTSAPDTPWFAIPADNKWYARLAVTHLLHEKLTDMDLTWPDGNFDAAEEKRRLASS